MPVIRLDSLDDPRLADYRAVRDPELLHTRNLFVAEGRLVVERLLATRRYTIRSLLLSDAAYAALGPTLAREPVELSIYLCHGADFLGLTGVDIHRGCLALVERPRLSTVDEVLAGVIDGRRAGRGGESGQRRRHLPKRRRVRQWTRCSSARHPAIPSIEKRFEPRWRLRSTCRSPGWRHGRTGCRCFATRDSRSPR